MRRLTTILMIVALAATTGCITGKVVRDGKTYTAETVASLMRQQAAAKQLRAAAEAAKAAGDNEACVSYARVALLIEAKAKPQAYRALWLADLNYPNADGSIPESGTEQPDPGPAPTPADPSTICGE